MAIIKEIMTEAMLENVVVKVLTFFFEVIFCFSSVITENNDL